MKTNKQYWQKYTPGSIPSVPQSPPKSLLNRRNLRVLDIGTGDGKLAEELSDQGHEVYGIDIAKNIIQANIERKSAVKYSVQDATKKTTFDPGFFDLAISKFVLTNIERDDRESFVEEIKRVLKPNGKLWILEPLISDSYSKRYELSKPYAKSDHEIVVFKDSSIAGEINTEEQMKDAFKKDLFSRVVKHYTKDEIDKLFSEMELIDSRIIEIKSPSGYIINTFEGIFEKAKKERLTE